MASLEKSTVLSELGQIRTVPNRRRLPVRPMQAEARLWSIADGQAVSYLRADCRSISKHRVLLPQQGLDAIEFPIAVGIILG